MQFSTKHGLETGSTGEILEIFTIGMEEKSILIPANDPADPFFRLNESFCQKASAGHAPNLVTPP